MDDLISRQDAIDALNGEIEITGRANVEAVKGYLRLVGERLARLPSAQQEIIRCKDCKYYGRADKRRFYRGMDCLNKHIDTIVPDKDFCSRAEPYKGEES